jgi:serine-type D-Ala-D-Ala carboxypeptidase (penicillin-binding protein 5/6)
MKLETLKINKKNFFSLKFFLSVTACLFLLIGSFWLGQVLKNYIYWKNTKDIYTAAIEKRVIDYSFLKPFRNWKIPALENLDAQAAISLADNTIVFEKQAHKILPIGSLSKIMTAYIALKNYQLEDKIKITKEIVATEEVKGYFSVGEILTIEELLHSALIESSNDAAVAITEIMGKDKFIAKMNEEAETMGLQYTHYVDPVGLDPDFEGDPYNYSTAYDIALLVKNILEESKNDPKVAKLFEITREKKYKINLANGNFHHYAYTTNEILEEFPDMLGAKTGQTPMAKQCFMVVLPKPKGEGYIINVILGSNNRFLSMKEIINWLEKAFVW